MREKLLVKKDRWGRVQVAGETSSTRVEIDRMRQEEAQHQGQVALRVVVQRINAVGPRVDVYIKLIADQEFVISTTPAAAVWLGLEAGGPATVKIDAPTISLMNVWT